MNKHLASHLSLSLARFNFRVHVYVRARRVVVGRIRNSNMRAYINYARTARGALFINASSAIKRYLSTCRRSGDRVNNVLFRVAFYDALMARARARGENERGNNEARRAAR